MYLKRTKNPLKNEEKKLKNNVEFLVLNLFKFTNYLEQRGNMQ